VGLLRKNKEIMKNILEAKIEKYEKSFN